MPTDFTPVQSLLGGMLIGLSATLLMLFNGRIAGATGIIGGLLPPFARRFDAADFSWRAAFVAGMVASPLLYVAFFQRVPSIEVVGGPVLLVLSGLIVGVGVTFGSGCTSGHGICGLARFSTRSLIAVLVFMAMTAVTVFVVRHVVGA